MTAGWTVKRIQRRPDGKLLVRSDNPKYESMIVPSVKIIGRVIWIGGMRVRVLNESRRE